MPTQEATTEEKPHAPYLMPNGQRLSNYLTDNGLLRDSPRRSSKKQRGARCKKHSQWPAPTSSVPRPIATPMSDLEATEMAALEKVGIRRRRRFLNDKLLRDLAGPMSAGDMASLFAPAPFGVVHESALTTIMQQQGSLWSHFLSIDYDKQASVLKRWEEHVGSTATTNAHADDASYDAMRRWAAIPRKLRAALRSTDVDVVAELECTLLEAMEKGETVSFHWDNYKRLIGHALARYHGFVSSSHDVDGERHITFRMAARGGGGGGRGGRARVGCAEVLAAVQEAGAGGACQGALQSHLGTQGTQGTVPVAAAAS